MPTDFERNIRSVCLAQNEDIGLDTSGFALPQHILLKISFEAGEQLEGILDAVEALLRRECQFYVNPSAIELVGNILWIAFKENGTLRRLHNLLDRNLKRDFGIPQHFFDKVFRFHSTLFVGHEEDIQRIHGLLKDYPCPEALSIDTFLLGVSESGKSGTYRVIREIKLKIS